MANSLCKFSTFIICLALLFSIYADEHTGKVDVTEFDYDGNGICQRPSALFHGPCLDNDACNNLCKGAEGAEEGYCTTALMCYCNKKCPTLCPRPSARFHGACFDEQACDNLCKGGEAAVEGQCHNFMCMCYYGC